MEQSIGEAARLAQTVAAMGCPAVLLGAFLAPDRTSVRGGAGWPKRAEGALYAVLGLAVFAALAQFFRRPDGAGVSGSLVPGFSVHLDALSVLMLVLVSFLGAVVARFSRGYLQGDPNQGTFSKWLVATVGSVILLVIVGNLFWVAVGWVLTSLSLHRLLVFQGDRPAAILAARKKFLMSRIGDVCMAGALALIWNQFGTWEFRELFEKVGRLDANGASSEQLSAACVMLAVGAMIKSAQIPFHSWLPDTMETPTPVSALMHAGVINAGGYLMVRLSPMISHSSMAMTLLIYVGAATAVFGSLVMLTQTSVKRWLAYSTVAQMGYMMLQCGLGAFALAILHLTAHSLYKAHAFLTAGGAAQEREASGGRRVERGIGMVSMGGVLAVAGMISGLAAYWIGGVKFAGGGDWILSGVFALASGQLLMGMQRSGDRAGAFWWGGLVAVAFASVYFGLHRAYELMLSGIVADGALVREMTSKGAMGAIAVMLLGLFVVQQSLASGARGSLLRSLYVHASQGFYLGTLANRLTKVVMAKWSR